jgi:Tol biopolymer transport system component
VVAVRRLGIAFGLSGLLLASVGMVAPQAHATFPGRNGRIVFEATPGGRAQIFSVRADGSNVRQLTHEPKGLGAFTPRWSADGRQIAFCVSPADCEPLPFNRGARVWVMNWDGSDPHKVTHDPLYSDFDPSWSPDGHHIVFTRCELVFGTCDIDAMRADGTHVRTLIAGHWHHRQPVYSPDGTEIAFTSDKGGYDSRVFVADADGTHLRAITPGRLVGDTPSWAPDGALIVFKNNASTIVSTLWTVQPDGSELRALVRWPSAAGSYAPNGGKILVSGLPPGCGCSGLVLINPNGTGGTPVVTSKDVPGAGGEIDWGVAR